ncbi:MAG TPA: XrtA system polysaccharide deacetylase [Stellaceae bacterium]|nr:XrtA system polysaccharide deacetylase [Stellaceae bacterium]
MTGHGGNARPLGVGLTHAMTVDVEDYFQVEAFADRIARASWEGIPRRVEANVDRLLDMFAAAEVGATFFTLGWVAERHPGMIRRIAAGGHEVASHGYDHRRADRLDPPRFREDIRRAKRILEDLAGRPVLGYRAPTFSIGSGNAWAWDILAEEGYRYSSSLYPIRHDLYGDAHAPRAPFRPAGGGLWEIPLTTRRICGQNFPAAGGGYFRLLPYRLSRHNLSAVAAVEAQPCIFYLHPWEIDAAQPRVAGIGWRTRLRHYLNLAAMPDRLARLVRDFRWGRMDEVFAGILYAAAAPAEPAGG